MKPTAFCSLAESLSDRLKGVTQHNPVNFSVLEEEYKEIGCTRAQLVEALNQILLPHGKFSGNDRGFWFGPPE